MSKRRRKGRRGAGAAAALAVVAAAAILAGAWALQQRADPGQPPGPPAGPPGGTLRVHYVDVGQGDGTIWEFPDGTLVVYDCGDVAASADDNPMVRYLRDTLRRPVGSDLHALVASHGHRDHVGGCDEVLEAYRFAHVYEAWYDGPDRPRSYQRFQDLVLAEGARLHTIAPTAATDREEVMRRWDLLELPASTNATAVLVWPEGMDATGWDDVATTSLGVRLAFGDASFCFQGDVETAQELRLAAEDPARDLTCDAYLVGHHGSREASSAAWLRRMAPRIAVASFGENPYGHPTAEALCRIQAAGATVYATHRDGPIVLETDGRDLRVTRGTPETEDYCAPGASYWT